ncbi:MULTISPECIES: hypothetical protein [Streptomyces]|uniref:Terpene synthase n=1 Tax=Streptomyces luteosporeus TaxID=173856 RepID=A0ABP6GL04_9ACTN
MTTPPGAGWRLPALHYPFPPEIHPDAGAAEAHVRQWARRQGLVTTDAEYAAVAAARFGDVVAREFPGATPAGLRLACEIYVWHFVFDDRYCDEPHHGSDTAGLAAAALRMLTTAEEALAGTRAPHLPGAPWPGPAGDPCARALADICHHLAALGTPAHLERFLAAERMYLLGVLTQSAAVQTGTPPSVGDYLTMRYYNCATPVALAVLDAAYGFELPDADHRHPDVRRLCRITAHVNGWANDVLSYGRESTRPGAAPLNLPTVLAADRNIGPQQALEEAARMHNEEIAAYLALEARVGEHAGPLLLRYLGGLRSMMRGFYDWGLATDRYRVGTHFTARERP